MVRFLYFRIFHSKYVIMLVLCLYQEKIIFINFTQYFKINDTVNFEDNSLVHFQWLSNQNFPFKVYNTDWIMPGFDKHFISNNFYWMVEG